jgi:hypothetical protein
MILIACFSLFILTATTGCNHTNPVTKAWDFPAEPELVQPKFEKEGDRLYLDKDNAVLLRNNIVELKAYQEKLEFLIGEMLDYYTK